MSEKVVRVPNAAHPIVVQPAASSVQVIFNGETVARSARALVMHEGSHPPVYYLPAADVVAGCLQPSSHSSYCPYKGEASYASLCVNGVVSKDAAWRYKQAFPAVAEIAGCYAFYPERVDSIEHGDD